MPKLPTRKLRVGSLDVEATGLDLLRGCLPYLVTGCLLSGEQTFWEWNVNPLDRVPIIPKADLDEINEYIESLDVLVFQNAKYDICALRQIGLPYKPFPHHKLRDTLYGGHLIASNRPHDLTSMAIQFLRVDISPFEKAVEEAVKAATAIVKDNVGNKFAGWDLARKGHPKLPSVKEQVWRNDMWLPREVAKALKYAPDHPWWTVLSEYANADSAVTVAIDEVQQEIIREREQEKIYAEHLRVIPININMEKNGTTVNRPRLKEKHKEYRDESNRLNNVCCNIARSYGYDLELPKSGNNNSLLNFVFGAMKLPVIKQGKKNPSLDSKVIDTYLETLPSSSKAHLFLSKLVEKRSRDTACQYMDGYERFWVPLGIFNEKGEQLWFTLHPNLNPVGTGTLRWSCSNPNEQNISRREGFNIRWPFGPKPGREWWSCDANNIEARLPAYESEERDLIELFEHPKEPPYYGTMHLLNFHTVYPVIWNKVEKEVGFENVGPECKKRFESTYYRWCKNGGFAKQYGGQRRKVNATFHMEGAFDLIDARFSKFSKLNRAQIDYARTYGYVETIPDKSIDPDRGYPIQCTRTDSGSILPTVPLNYHIQGSAMWWMCRAMVRCEEYLTQYNVGKPESQQAFITLQVHDELVFDFPAGKGDKPWLTNRPIINNLMSLMEQGGNDYGIPTPVSCDYHPDSWSIKAEIK